MAAPFLTVTCPGCGRTSDRVPSRLAGRTIRCSTCGARFSAPALDAAPEAPTVLEDIPAAAAASESAEPAATVAEAGEAAPTVPESGHVAPTAPEAAAVAPTVREGEAPPAPRPAAAPRMAGVDWQPGEVVLGLYEVIGVLGQGGMGRVYRVRHRGWDLDLAVKAPLPQVLEAAGGADLFQREAETWVNLGLHPHVVTCHYVRRAYDLPLVFAELVDGGSLLEAIRERRLSSLETILDVAVQAAWGLHYAHEQGLVHQDVKPANILLTSEGTAKVTDFGLARARPARGAPVERGPADGHTMTVEGGGGGTPAYLSPEQAAGEPLTRRSDLWSFALSLLEIFVGGRTWEYGLAAPEVLEDYQRGALRPAEQPEMPLAVADFLGRCFRERPEDRPRDLAEAATVLSQAWEDVAGRSFPRREPRGGRGSADGLNNRAVSLVDLGRVAEARTLWRRTLEAEPQHVEATYNAGLAEWSDGRLDDGELRRRLEEACTSHAAAARAHHLRGRVRLVLGDVSEAQAALARAAELGGTPDLARDVSAAGTPPTPPTRVLRGLHGPVSALTLTADGHTVIAGHGQEARIWDAATGTLLKTLALSEGPLRDLAVLPDGRFLLVAAEKAPLQVWDLVSGQSLKGWARHPGFPTCLAILPEGRLVLSGGSDRVVRLWDPATGLCVREMAGHEDAVTAVAAGTSHLASASRDGTVRLWSVEDGRPLAVLRGHEGRVNAVALSEADSRVVSAGDDRTVRDWGLNSHELVRCYVSHAGPVTALAIGPGGARVVSGGADCTIRGWDLDRERLVEFQRLDAAVHALVLAPDGQIWAAHGTAVSTPPEAALQPPPAALCRPSSAIEVESRAESFDEKVEEARRTLNAGDLTLAVSLARTARRIPGHERSGSALAIWDELCARLPRRALQSAWEEGRLSGHAEPVVAVAAGPRGERALSGSLDGTLRLWDLRARNAVAALSGHRGPLTSVVFLAGGERALSGSRDRTVRLWDLRDAQLLRTLEGHDETVTGVDVSPDGRLAASASWDGTVRLWDLRRGATLHVLEGHGANVAAVRIAGDGLALASVGWDGTVRLWDATRGDPVRVLEGHQGNVTAVAFHPTGRSLASGGEDGAVHLWDPRARRPVRTLPGHEGEITGLAFTPEGRFLLSSSRDRSVRVWDLRRGTPVRTLSDRVPLHGLDLSPLGNLLLVAGDRDVRVWHLDWEPEETATAGWDETARPFLETFVTRRRIGPSGPTVRMAVSDADVDGVVADLRRRGFGALTAETVRPRLEELTASPEAASYWDGLRRAAPRVTRAVPRAAGAVRRLPWLRLGLAAAAVVALGIGLAAWWRPPPKMALSPYMERAVRAEVDLIDLGAFSGDCASDAYGHHLDRLLTGNPQARDVACVAALSDAQTVAEILDRAPLTDPEPQRTHRLVRNAASALSGLPPSGLEALCDRLGDAREDVRRVVGLALSEAQAEAAAACVTEILASGGSLARSAAILPFRQLLARGVVTSDEGWALVQGLLQDADPEARIAGLRALSMFVGRHAEPAARPLLEDPDPAVAAAAREALSTIQSIHRTDLLRGNVRS